MADSTDRILRECNRPRWSGRGFEIWFFVLLVPERDLALWVRFTRFADSRQSDSRLWVTASRPGRLLQARDLHALDALRWSESQDDFALSLGTSRFGPRLSQGQCGDIRWDFNIAPRTLPVSRTPTLPGWLPAPTHAEHAQAESPVTGRLWLGDEELALDQGLLTQMHIWGTRRVEMLHWLWAPAVDGNGHAQVTAVAPRAGKPGLSGFSLQAGGQDYTDTGLLGGLRQRLSSPRAGLLQHVAHGKGWRVVSRCWAPPEHFAGWDYRQPDGGDLHVAQTNLAHAEIEIFRRAGLGWRPVQRVPCAQAALEFHGPDRLPGIHYRGWNELGPWTVEGADPQPDRLPAAPSDGRWVATPHPSRILAFGLTFREHARETGHVPEPVMFELDATAWHAGDAELDMPSTAQMLEVLNDLDPAHAAALASFGFLPALLDYEAELGLILAQGWRADEPVEALAEPGRIALVVANDLTARSIQILGEGRPDKLAHWSAAKSLPGFAPTCSQAWLPDRFELDDWPALRLETRVNGSLRQAAALSEMLLSPRDLLARARGEAGDLPAGTLILTGTPSGIALSVPAWKQWLGKLLLDGPGKLRATISQYSGKSDFLRPGDVVEVRAGWLGRLCHRIQAPLS